MTESHYPQHASLPVSALSEIMERVQPSLWIQTRHGRLRVSPEEVGWPFSELANVDARLAMHERQVWGPLF